MTSRVDAVLRQPLGPTHEEFLRRRMKVMNALDRRGADLFVGFDSAAVRYLTGYPVASAERPVAVVLDANGVTLFVPRLIAAQVRAVADSDQLTEYPEYPGHTHPMVLLADMIAHRRPRAIVMDRDGYSDPRGYRGPSLVELVELVAAASVDPWMLQVIRMRKSTEEIALIRQAADWSVFGEQQLEGEIASGRTEREIAAAATSAAMASLRRQLPRDRQFGRPTSINADFGGQVGVAGTSRQGAPPREPVLAAGDSLITRVGAWIGGYYCDIERTLIVGRPTEAFAELFQRGVELQEFARAQIVPGTAVAEVDAAVYGAAVRLGLEDCWQHHTGHSVGLYEREAPYLDVGAPEVLEPGMVLTVEPGLYQAGVGGFRHSDCLLVTDTHHEILTEHPRDLHSLSCE